jgi:hypothetical protein
MTNANANRYFLKARRIYRKIEESYTPDYAAAMSTIENCEGDFTDSDAQMERWESADGSLALEIDRDYQEITRFVNFR